MIPRKKKYLLEKISTMRALAIEFQCKQLFGHPVYFLHGTQSYLVDIYKSIYYVITLLMINNNPAINWHFILIPC